MKKSEFCTLVESIVRKKLQEMGSWENGQASGNRDESRVTDILEKANGSISKKIQLTTNMVNSITKQEKAIARYLVALKMKEKEMAAIFYARARALGYNKPYGSK